MLKSWPSTFTGFLAFALALYMAHATLATLPVFIILGLVLIFNNWLAHMEGRWSARREDRR